MKFNFNILFIFLFISLFIGSLQELKATHAMGADLTYSCLGNNQYRIRLQFYRDCNGINASATETVQLSAVGCTNLSLTLNQISVTEITPSCPGIVGTACNNRGGQFGIQFFVYEGIITLPSNCSNWTINWTLCCRNNAITTLSSPGSNSMTLRSSINSAICNNSPTFSNNPTPFVCNNQAVFYNHGATDIDGDQLRYTLTPCLNTGTAPVSYAAGYSATTPFTTSTGLTIDSTTGAINFTPSAVQIGVICVKVEEFRNGQKIGEVVRDIQFTVVNCTNMMPTLSGINGSNLYADTITIGQQYCFNVFSNDPDSGQVLTLTYNNAINNGSFSSAGSPLPTGVFCWTPTLADTGWNSFTIQVMDNYCPIVGQNTYTYSLFVPTPPTNPICNGLTVSVVSSGNLLCTNNDGNAVILASGGVEPYTYSLILWSNNTVFSNQTGIFNNLPAGNYSIFVHDSLGCTSTCINQSLNIQGQSNPLTSSAISTNSRCAAGPNAGGTIGITANGGLAPYQYSIGNGFSTNNTFSNLAAGTYQAVVIDANGCSSVNTVTISFPAPINIAFSNIIQPTCGRLNGRIRFIASGGLAPYTYTLNGVAVTSNTATGLGNGVYVVVATDANGCQGTASYTLNGNTFTLSQVVTNVTCNGDCDGRILLNSTNPVSYLWNTGSSANPLTNLCAGTYTVTANNGNGCVQTRNIRITQPAVVTVRLASTTDEGCIRNNGTATLTATGGTAPYIFSITNTSTGATYFSTTGQFTGLAAGTYRYSATDVRGCSPSTIRQFRIRYVCTGNLQAQPGEPNQLSRNLITASPNPAKNVTEISYLSETDNQVKISLVDLNGKPIKWYAQLPAEGRLSLEIAELTPSTYFVLMQSLDGKVLSSAKLVIIR